jgi:hypothetical protein
MALIGAVLIFSINCLLLLLIFELYKFFKIQKLFFGPLNFKLTRFYSTSQFISLSHPSVWHYMRCVQKVSSDSL